MRNGKYSNSKKGSRVIVLLMALMLLVGSAIGGTLAWLISTTEEVTDTFTYGDVTILLAEGKDKVNDAYPLWSASTHTKTQQNDQLKMIPGNTTTFNPYVIVSAKSEPCYVFVKVEPTIKSDLTFSNYITHSVLTGENAWKALPDVSNVYYQEIDVSTASEDAKLQVIAGDTVTVKNTVTKADLTAVANQNDRPKIAVTAYAIQKNYLTDTSNASVATAEGAWTVLQNNLPSNP